MSRADRIRERRRPGQPAAPAGPGGGLPGGWWTGPSQQIPPDRFQPTQDLFVTSTPGEHQWATVVTYTLTADECASAFAGEVAMQLDVDHLRLVAGPLCLICERPWAAAAGRRCPGDPNPVWQGPAR